MLTQTWAIFVDAYRELNSKKLFWITLALSGLVVVVFAMFGLNDRGMTFLHWTFDNDILNTRFLPADKLYLYLFATLAVPLWLTWVQVILALISTAPMFPDMIASGAIETVLSKPISRTRLFLTKYAAGLLFVTFQVLVFCVACFLVIGLRGGAWRPSLFLAVPIVVVFFSYLFCLCAVIGLLTRSTIAALMLTILAWFGIFLLNSADAILLMQRERSVMAEERIRERIPRAEAAARASIEAMAAEGGGVRDESGNLPPGASDELEAANPFLGTLRQQLPEAEREARTWRAWSARVMFIKSLLPKTGETTGLLSRYLLTSEERALIEGVDRREGRGGEESDSEPVRVRENDPELARRLDAAMTDRSVGWIVGTSLAFEAVVLGFGAWRFSRRDF